MRAESCAPMVPFTEEDTRNARGKFDEAYRKRTSLELTAAEVAAVRTYWDTERRNNLIIERKALRLDFLREAVRTILEGD